MVVGDDDPANNGIEGKMDKQYDELENEMSDMEAEDKADAAEDDRNAPPSDAADTEGEPDPAREDELSGKDVAGDKGEGFGIPSNGGNKGYGTVNPV